MWFNRFIVKFQNKNRDNFRHESLELETVIFDKKLNFIH